MHIHAKDDLKRQGNLNEKPEGKQGSPRMAQEESKRYTRHPQRQPIIIQGGPRDAKRVPKRFTKPPRGSQTDAQRDPREHLWEPRNPQESQENRKISAPESLCSISEEVLRDSPRMHANAFKLCVPLETNYQTDSRALETLHWGLAA